VTPRLALVFLYLGVVSFGGGLAIVPEMHRQLVDGGFLREGEFVDGYAIGQLAPGPNMLSLVFYGYRLAGVPGALVATVATFGPGILVCALLGRLMVAYAERPVVARVRRGLVPVGVGLMAAGVLVLGRSVVVGPVSGVLVVLTALVVWKKWLPPAAAVVTSGAIGSLFAMLAP
jgi:chromate transporter